MKAPVSYIILILICTCMHASTQAQTEVHTSVMPRLKVIPGAVMTTKNSAYSDSNPGGQNFNVQYHATVDLVYGREKRTDLNDSSWGYRVEFEIYDGQNALIDTGSVHVQTFNNNSIYLDRRTYPTDSVAHLEITGVFVSTNNWVSESGSLVQIVLNVPSDIRLELRLEARRYDHLDAGTAIPDLILTETSGVVHAEWPHVTGAEHYELEYAFLTDSVIEASAVNDLFKNATRVEVRDNNFALPGTYPSGHLSVRIRPIGRFVQGISDPVSDHHIRAGVWSDSTTIHVNFESAQNWQTTTSYAEDGKFKKVVEYFDDALKNRQTATNLSSEDVILRTTTHYDFEGRPNVTILPAPDLSNGSLGLHSTFNVLDPEDFDPTPLALGSTDGAGLYYSTSNPQDQGLHARYIPDAGGYPYSQIKYLNDGTGRVLSQSGVGDFYKIGSGHETKYFYDDPTDTQLRRLFGQNVGAAKYYKRNVVQDANGQFSVSYIDIAGRTIATALEGYSPENVIPLESEESMIVVHNLMENNTVDTITGESRVVTTILNTDSTGTVYTFDYSFTGLIIEHGMDVCIGCRYELILDIRDPYGMPVAFNGGTDTIEYTGEDMCGDTTFVGTPAISFEVTFDEIGSYTVTKILRPIPLSMEEWIQILSDSMLLPDIAYFDSLFLSQVDTTECIQSCEQLCRDIVLAMDSTLTGEALDSAILECMKTECLDSLFYEGSTFLCDGMYAQMIMQIMPGGCQDTIWHSQLDGLAFIVEGDTVVGDSMLPILTSNLIWEEGWADTLVHLHPEYCCYKHCLDKATSRQFDLALNINYSWTDVESDVLAILTDDPFFKSGGPGFDHSNMMHIALQSYGTNENGNADTCIEMGFSSPIDLVELIQCVMPNGTEEDWWDFFVGAYLGLKADIESLVQGEACNVNHGEGCDPVCQEIPEDFAEIEDVDDAIDFLNENMDSLCTDICEGQATMIANMLFESCGSGSWLELHNLVVQHCDAICGWQNPMGVLLYEDQEMVGFEAIRDWLVTNGCDTAYFDTVIVQPFDSVYIALGTPSDAGIDVADTICTGDTIDIFVLHDSVYQASIDTAIIDSLIGNQQFLLDTGLYYLVGYDPLCTGDTLLPGTFGVVTDSANLFGVWPPDMLVGIHPQIYGITEPGCYIFGFYAPTPEGACSEYTEVTLYLPGCEHEHGIVIDSVGSCVASATLNLDSLQCNIDTIIWTVSIDGGNAEPYNSPDTLSGGALYAFSAAILYDCCCPVDTLLDTLECCIIDATISGSVSNLCVSSNGLDIPRTFQPAAAEIQGATYSWNFGAGASPATASTYGPHNITYSSTGTKVVTLLIDNGECSDTDTISFLVVQCSGNIAGKVKDNLNNGFQGVNVQLFVDANQDGQADGGTQLNTATTQSNGSYAFVSVPTGHYVIIEAFQPSGYSNLYDGDDSPDGDAVTNSNTTDDIIPCTITPSKNDLDNNFVEIADSATISGYVIEDLDSDLQWDSGEGIEGVTVHLFEDYDEDGVADDGTPYLTEMTDSDGAYSFYPVVHESYVIVEVQPLYYVNISDLGSSGTGDLNDLTNSNTTDDIIPVTVSPGEHDSNNRFIEECDICEEQSVDVEGGERIDSVVTVDGVYINLPDLDVHCFDSASVDAFVVSFESVLDSIDPCGMSEVTWEEIIENDTCVGIRFIVTGSAIWLDTMIAFGGNDLPFDHTNCNGEPFRSQPTINQPSGDENIGVNANDIVALYLYPNPASNSFTLEFYHSYEIPGKYTVQIFDIHNSLAYEGEYFSDGNIEKVLFHTHSYPAGVYTVVVRDPLGIYAKKLVLIK